MILLERLDSDIKEAMKAKQEAVLSTLRLVRSAIKNKQIDTDHPMTEEEIVAIMRGMVKQYRDALADFTSAGRTDLADKQVEEIAFIERYLPAAMNQEELLTIAQKVFADMGDGPKDFGRVMGAVMKQVQGRADGAAVRSVVEQLLK